MLPPANAPTTAPKPRAKRQKKTATTELPAETDESSQAVSGAQDTDSNATPAAKLKKPRAPRAKRAPKSAATVVEDENGNVIETEEPAPRPAPKPRKPRQKKKQPQQVEGEDGGTGQDDPSDDPANHEIDVTETTMFELTKDRGLGKVSERETKMAAIDWDEVHRKRVAEAEAIRAGIDPATLNSSIQPTENNEGGEGGEGENTEETTRPAPVVTGPRLRIDAEGNLVVDEDSLRIDRQAQAERNAENLIVTENDDLTKRVNQMSWINERRRDPTDRVPFFKMKSDPWSDEETDRFYEALRMFGTDFFIISKMFQPKTRRQIKLKFIREERLDADRINRVLAGEAVAMDLGSFAEATGQDLEGFKDPRELEEELRVEGEEQRVEIARKKKEMEEAKEQRDIQMAAREKDQEERAAQRREKAAMRQNKRRGIIGTGTF
jgi:transcription factor TFIIIB component B''